MAPRTRDLQARERRRSERRGRMAEAVARQYLRLKGFRILERRFKCGAGEIDIIAVKGRRIAFVEVKARRDLEACEAAITSQLRSRVRKAAGIYMSRQSRFRDYDVGFDIVFIRPRRWPMYLEDGL